MFYFVLKGLLQQLFCHPMAVTGWMEWKRILLMTKMNLDTNLEHLARHLEDTISILTTPPNIIGGTS